MLQSPVSMIVLRRSRTCLSTRLRLRSLPVHFPLKLTPRPSLGLCIPESRTLPVTVRTLSSCSSSTTSSSSVSKCKSHGSSQTKGESTLQKPTSLTKKFWTCRATWRRAGINTLRCLVGCTLGDFSALWMLQTYFPEMGMGYIMGLSMASGLTTSLLLETILLHHGADRLPWIPAARTAMGMSFISMLAMEAAENVVDYHLTGGVVALHEPGFWAAAGVSVAAGLLAPLPYNYWRLKRYGRGCH